MITFAEFMTEDSRNKTSPKSSYEIHYKVMKHFQKMGLTKLGSGVQSQAFSHPSESGHHIWLVTKTDSSRDPKMAYLKSISDSAANPHFPRIEKTTTFHGNDNKQIHVSKVEKLHHLDTLEPKELHQLYHHSFGEEYQHSRRALSPESFSDILDSSAIGGVVFHQPNPELKSAIDHVVHVQDNNPGMIDIHANNIMARKTPHGHQLVMTDPLYHP